MRKFRLKALKHFERRPMPWWGADLSDIDFENIYYFIRSTEKQAANWDELPEDIKGTWDKLGIPEAEKKYSAGSGPVRVRGRATRSSRSSTTWGSCSPTWTRRPRPPGPGEGVFRHADPAQRQQVRRAELGRLVRWILHLRAARRARRHPAPGLLPDQRGEHGAVRADADHRGRGLLRALRRGMLAPIYTTDSLHSAVVEIIAKKARVRYTTIQNWSTNVYNLVTKRARPTRTP